MTSSVTTHHISAPTLEDAQNAAALRIVELAQAEGENETGGYVWSPRESLKIAFAMTGAGGTIVLPNGVHVVVEVSDER